MLLVTVLCGNISRTAGLFNFLENYIMAFFKHDTEVQFNNGVIYGKGWIKGIASASLAVLGTGYIVEVARGSLRAYLDDELIKYPYSCIVIHEVYIEEIVK